MGPWWPDREICPQLSPWIELGLFPSCRKRCGLLTRRVERTGGSRYARRKNERQRRLLLVARPDRLMSARIPSQRRVDRILKRGVRCFLPPALRLGRPPPKGVVLSADEECLGGIWGKRLEAILTNRGAYFLFDRQWKFVAYRDVQEISFPEKTDPRGALTLRTPVGSVDLLRGTPDLWTVGKFFIYCADDAKAA
jgi:hypothetical protein